MNRFATFLAALLFVLPVAAQADYGAAAQYAPSAAQEAPMQQSSYTVIDFWGPQCPPCRRFLPVFEQVSQEMAGKLTFRKVNTSEDYATGQQYNVRSIPTIILLRDGREVSRFVGYQDAASFKAWLQRNMH